METMYKQKLGMSVGYNYPIPTLDVVKMLKNIGFDAISPEWRDGSELAAVIETAREYGLICDVSTIPSSERQRESAT